MRAALVASVVALGANVAPAAVKTETVTLTSPDGKTLKAFLAYDDAADGKRPGVLVFHEWWGLDDYAKKRAAMLAEMGYVALAMDMYGDGKSTKHSNEAGEMANTVRQNTALWEGRAKHGLAFMQKHDRVDPAKIAAIGYCFGGSTAIQLAMTGADVKAVVSFHGALPAPTEQQAKAIKGKVLICHGANDTFVPENVCEAFRAALRKAKVDFQMNYYGNAVHSFTVPGGEAAGIAGIAYNAEADRRSWREMKALFDEVFGK